jgi:methylated-DNA-protein-cysteine methyltransferase-like protein
MSKTEPRDIYEAIYNVVRAVPYGRVTTYGAVAAAIGAKSGARMVGYALNHCGGLQPPVPAHRIVNRCGVLSGRYHFVPEQLMQQMLEEEEVKVEGNKVIDFDQCFWDPLIEL